MTPLAFELLKDLTTPGAFHSTAPRTFAQAGVFCRTDRDSYWRAATEAHFFDLSAVTALVENCSEKMREAFNDKKHFSRRLAFLPAPVTWLESAPERGMRQAKLLTSADDNTSAAVTMIAKHPTEHWVMIAGGKIPLVGSDQMPAKFTQKLDPLTGNVTQLNPQSSLLHFNVYAALALINSPRIIGRRQHMPHERIERDKLKALGLVGKFPLHAWTEIVLKVAPPDDRTGEPATEGHLTGEKCLHFVRTFLRVRMGQLEYVESHWRGNPALGMKRSRYRLEPGAQP